MKIVFFGTAEFGVNSLKSLIKSGHRIQAVVTQPDRKKGRGQKLQPSPIKLLAEQYDLPVYQPIKPADIIPELKKLNPGLFVVVSYGHILPKQILEIPELGCINLHPSLLPKYRGAAPINWALISGEEKTGISVIRINESVDSGEIILQESVEISPDDDVISLSEKLSLKGAGLLLEAVKLIEEGNAKFIPQDEAKATYAPKLKKEDGLIDWRKPAITLHNLLRGSVLWPGMYTHIKGKALKIWKTRVCPEAAEISAKANPGQIIGLDKEKGILVKTGKDILCLKELQLEGKKKMGFTQFLLGHPLSPGQMLGEKEAH